MPESVIDQFDISNPSNMHLSTSISGVAAPQRLLFAGDYLLVPGSSERWSGISNRYGRHCFTTIVLKANGSVSVKNQCGWLPNA